MKRNALTLLGVVFLVTGCASHYYREEAGGVKLYLKDSQAAEVLFASSLDGFAPHRTEKADAKMWQITVPKAEAFQYFYLVDGKIHLPDCPYKENDDFGSYNCLYKTNYP